MPKDPIVEEVRQLRQEMMNDLFVYLQNEQAKYRDRMVRLPAKKAFRSHFAIDRRKTKQPA